MQLQGSMNLSVTYDSRTNNVLGESSVSVVARERRPVGCGLRRRCTAQQQLRRWVVRRFVAADGKLLAISSGAAARGILGCSHGRPASWCRGEREVLTARQGVTSHAKHARSRGGRGCLRETTGCPLRLRVAGRAYAGIPATPPPPAMPWIPHTSGC